MFASITPQYKICTKCKILKPSHAFSRSSRNKNGLRSECKKCVHDHYINNKDQINARAREYVKVHQEQIDIYQRQYRKDHKEEIKAQQAVYREAHKEEKREQDKRYNKENRASIRKTSQRWRDKNRDKARSYQRKWRLNNLESERKRAKEYWNKNKDKRRINKQQRRAYELGAEGSHTIEDIRDIYRKQNGLCYYCCREVTWETRHDDHATPLSRGGSNWASNIVISCPSCNLSKSNKTAEEYIEYLNKRGAG